VFPLSRVGSTGKRAHVTKKTEWVGTRQSEGIASSSAVYVILFICLFS
jgi:hypothetical protein